MKVFDLNQYDEQHVKENYSWWVIENTQINQIYISLFALTLVLCKGVWIN